MRQRIFAIYDRAACCYSQPFYQQTRGLGERAFTDAICDEKSAMHAHPGDYDLFDLGEYDNEDGCFVGGKPLLLVTGIQVLSLRAVADG